VQMSVNQARSKSSGSNLPLILGQGQYQDGSNNVAIDLLSGYEFKTGADTTQYPRIVAIAHGNSPNLSTKHHTLSGTDPNATGVPRAINSSTGAPLVLTFSQPMDRASVEASRLTFTELDQAGTAAQAKLDGGGNKIQLHLDLDSTLISRDWESNDKKLKVEVVNAGTLLLAGSTYGVQMSVNQARSKPSSGTDLPLILGAFSNTAGGQQVDLLAGYQFTVNQAPRIDSVIPAIVANKIEMSEDLVGGKVISVVIADDETVSTDLVLTVTSLNTTVLPNTSANIIRAGTGGTRTVPFKPLLIRMGQPAFS